MNIIKIIFSLVSVFSLIFSNSQTIPQRVPSPLNVKQIHCGHSLTSPLFNPWPGQYTELVAKENSSQGWLTLGNIVGRADLPGAWLTMHWNYTTSPCWPNCYESNQNPRLNINLWDLLVITENFEGPANNSLNNSKENLLRFVNHAWQNGKNGLGTSTLLWTNWPGLDGSEYYFHGYGIPEATDGSARGWRQLLDILEYKQDTQQGWIAMQKYVNANRVAGSTYLHIIPGNRMMAKIYDDIQDGSVPTITHINQIFLPDGVHLNNVGAYMVTMIHYACIFGKSPVGLSNHLHENVIINQALATYIQNMVWNLVINYPESGIKNSLSDESIKIEEFEISPNPTTEFIKIQRFNTMLPITLYNMSGEELLKTNADILNLSQFENGIYFIKVNNSIKKIIKN